MTISTPTAPAGRRPLDPAGRDGSPADPGCGTPLPGGRPGLVHDLVAGFARTDPHRTAVVAAGRSVDYRTLDGWAGRIAARLTAAGIGRGSLVGVLAAPSTGMVAAVLGVLRAGAAFVPVDPANPPLRTTELLAGAGVVAVVTAGDVDPGTLPGVPVVPADAEERTDTPAGPPVVAAPDDPAYVIHTSGSTGRPKGVLVEHGQLAASTLARRLVYPGAPVFLLVSPLAFDSSMAGLWGTLTAGGTLVVATPEEVRDPEALVRTVERHAVTMLLCVPSLYRVVLDAADRLGPTRLRSLDTVVVAGEPLPPELMTRHFAVHGGPVALVNEYGPTEATVWASCRRYDEPGAVSVGRPVPGARLYVLDDQQRPVPSGCEGELYIGGAGVARGYLGRPEATARAFHDDPFAPAPGGRMYRTGDLVRWNADGMLDFLGRRDHQVKIRGHRIELGHVEARLCELPGVREAVVVPDAEHTALAGYVLAPSRPDAAPLRARLAELLPAVMVPTRITVLDAFPRTVNGKADRAALAALAAVPTTATADGPPATAEATAQPAPPKADGDLTARVGDAWRDVLAVDTVPRDVNFFDLGGHSLAMFRLQDALEARTGTRPSVVALFRHTTVTAQAELIRTGGADADATRGGDRHAAARRARALRAERQRAGREAAK
ncbi:non-ribosomal peptide synthetase [Kitasatospora sp. NBC_01539]|uniref:non-ribosomal peptide synthetase n=1 Tax=Kitasatospora sp. NBC_01539 TaxID=2903577 RepID=UPI0038601893